MNSEESNSLAKDIAALAACVSLDRISDPYRVLPTLAPAALWRILPRLLRKAAPHMQCATSREFSLTLARTIEQGKPAPVIAGGKAS